MKVFIEKQPSHIELPDDFATLEKINSDGSFVYRFKYNASIPKILGNNKERSSITVEINILKNIAVESTVKIFDQGFDPKQIVKLLKQRETLQRQLNRRKKRSILKTRYSDISKRIPNSETRRISGLYKKQGVDSNSSKTNYRPKEDDPLRLTSRYVPVVKSVESLEAGFKTAPILEVNLNKNLPTEEDQATAKDIRRESLNLLFLNKLDPAMWYGQRTNSIVPAMKQFFGVNTKTSYFYRNQNDPNTRKKTDILIKSFLTKAEVASHAELPNAKFVNVITKVEDDIARIEEIITIEEELLNSDSFLVEFDLINPKGILIQRLTGVVKHARNVALIQRPVVAPYMSVTPIGRNGKNMIQLRQLDENATKIALYKKEIQASQHNFSNEYEKFQVVELDKEDTIFFTEDKVITNNPVIYRAIPVGSNGDMSAEFSSVVVQSQKVKTSLKENFLRRPNFLTLYNEIQGRTNVLYIDNIPNGPISLEVYRKDLGIKNDYQLVEKVYLELEANRPVEVDDSGLRANRIYEYKCKLLYPDGCKIDAGNNLIVEYTPLESNNINLSIQNVEHGLDEDVIDVSFDIVKTAISKQLDTVKSAILSQNITEYEDAIKNEKESLQNLFFIQVLRQDLLTGEIENFGIVEEENFSDKNLGPVRNVSELQPGRAYKYSVVAYSRPAETLLPNYTRTANSGSTNSYEIKPSKYLHPITLSEEGSIVTEASLKKNHAKGAFTQGKIVDIQYVDVNLGSFLPKVEEAKAEVVNKSRTLLKWRIKGNSNFIDHFIIVLEINGMRTIVGKSHAIGGSNQFQFVDLLDNGEHGPLEYIIVPVYYDYTRGSEVRFNTIFI